MHMIHSRVLNQPGVIITILKNVPTLDPVVIIMNSPIVLFRDDTGKLVAFVTIKKFWNAYELGTGYTDPSFRYQGYARELALDACNTYSPIFALCKESLATTLQREGFSRTFPEKNFVTFRQKLWNVFLAPIFGYDLVCLKYEKIG